MKKGLLDLNDGGTNLKNCSTLSIGHKVSTYDCIVPVTGAQDSHFIVHLVKGKIKTQSTACYLQ